MSEGWHLAPPLSRRPRAGLALQRCVCACVCVCMARELWEATTRVSRARPAFCRPTPPYVEERCRQKMQHYSCAQQKELPMDETPAAAASCRSLFVQIHPYRSRSLCLSLSTGPRDSYKILRSAVRGVEMAPNGTPPRLVIKADFSTPKIDGANTQHRKSWFWKHIVEVFPCICRAISAAPLAVEKSRFESRV